MLISMNLAQSTPPCAMRLAAITALLASTSLAMGQKPGWTGPEWIDATPGGKMTLQWNQGMVGQVKWETAEFLPKGYDDVIPDFKKPATLASSTLRSLADTEGIWTLNKGAYQWRVTPQILEPDSGRKVLEEAFQSYRKLQPRISAKVTVCDLQKKGLTVPLGTVESSDKLISILEEATGGVKEKESHLLMGAGGLIIVIGSMNPKEAEQTRQLAYSAAVSRYMVDFEAFKTSPDIGKARKVIAGCVSTLNELREKGVFDSGTHLLYARLGRLSATIESQSNLSGEAVRDVSSLQSDLLRMAAGNDCRVTVRTFRDDEESVDAIIRCFTPEGTFVDELGPSQVFGKPVTRGYYEFRAFRMDKATGEDRETGKTLRSDCNGREKDVRIREIIKP